MKKIRVWDLPLRLFHWTLVLLVVAAIVAQKIGGDAMLWHFRFGYAALTLVLFRIVWGLVGSRYARFSDFVKRPSAAIAYIKEMRSGTSIKSLGHNPIGSFSVLALLAIILIQTISGLFASDEHDHKGPLAKFLSETWPERIGEFHADVSGTLIYILVGLHVVAIAYYYFIKKENLVKPMITGDKEVDCEAPSAEDSSRIRLFALVILLVCAVGVYFVVML
ncbi:MAG TPA: cytochrome b/b6 domain-containing protein [Burkholderiaceae bacterium]